MKESNKQNKVFRIGHWKYFWKGWLENEKINKTKK